MNGRPGSPTAYRRTHGPLGAAGRAALSLCLALALATLLLAVPPVARADEVVAQAGPDGTVPASGDLVTVIYRLAEGEGEPACLASADAPLTLTVSAPPEVTPNPEALTFVGCDAPRAVVYRLSAPGRYTVSLLPPDDAPEMLDLARAEVTLVALALPPVGAPRPRLELPDDISVPANIPTGAVVEFVANAWDEQDGTLPTTCIPASGGVFPVGRTLVLCTATNRAGSSAQGAFTVTVVSAGAPLISVPADRVVEAVGPEGASVTYSVSAWHAMEGAMEPECRPASGEVFGLGTTLVTCSATDSEGATARESFAVTVVDTTPPVLVLPGSITEEATTPDGAAVVYPVSAWDVVDGAIQPACAPETGAMFGLGTTTVQCLATDNSGNTAQGSFEVTVRDTTPPVLYLPDDMRVRPNRRGEAEVRYRASAQDAVDGEVPVDCRPASGEVFALGTTTVSCTAVDAAGNLASGTFTVEVSESAPGGVLAAGAVAGPSAPLLFGGLVSLSVLIAFVAAWRLLGTKDPVEDRLREYGASAVALADASGTVIGPTRRPGRGPLTKLVSGTSLAAALSSADLPFTAAEFGLLIVGAAALGFLVGTVRIGLLGGVALGVLAGYLPIMYLRMAQTKRRRAITEQLPDVLTLLVGALRAGHGLTQALDMLMNQVGPPMATELRRVSRAVSLGLPVQRALSDMANRVGSDDLDLVVTAINVQYEMGGNLAQTLEIISETVRDRIRMLREIRVMTAQQRLTGVILALLPLGLGVVLFLMNPAYMSRLFEPGWIRLVPAVAVVMQILGYLVIRRVLDIEV